VANFELVADGHTTSVYQDAVRLLLLIAAAAEPLSEPKPTDAPSDAVAVLHSQVLLQKLDFWLRNPDYLADELISRFERDGNPEDLDLARHILESDEPEVRSYQMLRYLFGAYEPLDEALSVLRTPGLVTRRKQGSNGHITQHDYYLTDAGRAAARTIVDTAPDLSYYVERSTLVADLAAGRRGSALRDIQYLQPEYADAALGTHIAGIAARARQRLKDALANAEGGQQ
jgi:Predicted dehydrogenases and related proteins